MFNFVFIQITFLVQNKTVVDDAVFFLGETTLTSKTIDNFQQRMHKCTKQSVELQKTGVSQT